MMYVDVEQVMAKIRDEVVRRGGKFRGDVLETAATTAHAGPWSGALPPLPVKASYNLHELLAYSDEPFVHNAYLAILRRPADQAGFDYYVDKLRRGALTKVEVLRALRFSGEGRTHGVLIQGLESASRLQLWRRRRVIGPVIAWCHGLLRLGRFAVSLSLVEAAESRENVELGKHINRLADVLEHRLASECTRHTTDTVSLHQRVEAFEAEARERMSTLEAEARVRMNALEATVARLNAVDERRCLQAREAEAFQRSLDPFYVAFEQRFRGSSELVRARATPYLDILRDAQVGDATRPVLDLGCGNGDWLDVLRQHGFVARGVDSNRTFVEICRGKGLDVVEGDVLMFLRSLPDGAVGAVTGMHLAEHLPFDVLITMIDECRRVLCKGGVLALETPNPENLLVGSHYFYMDPTHRNPLPPEALRWIVEARGFHLCRIERWTVAREMALPRPLEADAPGAEVVNFMLERLSAAPDYAVIGRHL